MAHRISLMICVGACLALGACNSGPSSSASSSPGKDEAGTLERKVDHLEGLAAKRGAAAAVLDDLMSALPDRTWLMEAAYDSRTVLAKGTAPSNNLVADYLSRLEGRPSLMNVALRSSAMKNVRGRESQEFTLEAAVRSVESATAPSDLPPAARLAELEKALPPRQDDAEILREVQRLALESGLQMTRFTPGAEIPGEFTSEWPVAIEVSGGQSALRRYLDGLAGLPRLWIVDKFSLKAVSGTDPRSDIRALMTAKTFILR